MKKLGRFRFKGGVKILIAVVTLGALMCIVTPIFADPPTRNEGATQQGTTIRKNLKAGMVNTKGIIESFSGEIRGFRISDTGDSIWCDVLIGTQYISGMTPKVEYRVVSTTEPIINNFLLMANVNKHRVIIRGEKISTPKGRKWPTGDYPFYKIREVEFDKTP